MATTIVFHVQADRGAAVSLVAELNRLGIASRVLSIGQETYASDVFADADNVVGLVSHNSIEDSAFIERVRSIEAENTNWYPVRVDNVDVQGALDYYLQVRQWLDIIDGDSTQIRKLATSLSSVTATPIAETIVSKASVRNRNNLYWAIGAFVLAGIAAIALLYQFSNSVNAPEDVADATPREVEASAPNIYAYMQENSAYPFFDPEGNMLNVSMDVFTRQIRPVEASYYRQVSENVAELLGEWSGVPKAEYGQQTFSFPIAREVSDGLLCVRYDLDGPNGGRERHIYIHRVTADYSQVEPLLSRKSKDGESCNTAIDMSVDRNALPLLNIRAALLDAHNNHSITLADDLIPENGGWRLRVLTLAEKSPPQMTPTTLYLFGGDSPTDQKPLLRMRSQDGYPVYYGPQPKHVTLCVNSVVGDWTISSIAKGVADNANSFSVGDQTLSILRGEDACNKLAADEKDFAGLLKWPRGSSLVPPSTELVGVSNLGDRTFRLSGLTLGMNFDEAVEQIKLANGELQQLSGSGKEMLDDVYTYALDRTSEFVSPDRVFKNARYVSFETRSPLAKIVLVNDGTSRILNAVMVLLQPDLTLVQNQNPFVGSSKFIKDLEELFGTPAYSDYQGQHYEGESESLYMVWSKSANKGCRVEKTDTPIMGTGGRSGMVERWVTTEKGVCPYNLEVRYGRQGYNAVVSFLLIESDDQ